MEWNCIIFASSATDTYYEIEAVKIAATKKIVSEEDLKKIGCETEMKREGGDDDLMAETQQSGEVVQIWNFYLLFCHCFFVAIGCRIKTEFFSNRSRKTQKISFITWKRPLKNFGRKVFHLFSLYCLLWLDILIFRCTVNFLYPTAFMLNCQLQILEMCSSTYSDCRVLVMIIQ